MENLFKERRKSFNNDSSPVKKTEPCAEAKFYLRESTSEWVLEITISIPESVLSTTRFVGKTPQEAYDDYFKWNNSSM